VVVARIRVIRVIRVIRDFGSSSAIEAMAARSGVEAWRSGGQFGSIHSFQ
jgi:hypothetical protein